MKFTEFYVDYIKNAKKSSVMIDSNTRCPLACPFCLRESKDAKYMIQKGKDITVSNVEKLLMFLDKLNFCGQISDPIYHLKFLDILEVCSKNPNKTISIHTNGTRKSMDWWKKAFVLGKENVTWIFGLDGATQQTAEMYRVNTLFDEVMNVMKLGVSLGAKVEWQFIVFKHNEHEIETLKQLCEKNNFILRIVKSSRWPRTQLEKYSIESPSDRWIADKKGEVPDREWQFPKLNKKIIQIHSNVKENYLKKNNEEIVNEFLNTDTSIEELAVKYNYQPNDIYHILKDHYGKETN